MALQYLTEIRVDTDSSFLKQFEILYRGFGVYDMAELSKI